jgi:iron(III) transport system ATP-binding protein
VAAGPGIIIEHDSYPGHPVSPNPAHLQITDLQHRYGEQIIVDNLSLQLAEGEIGCLLGSSGCGKTTVLRCIAGFEHARSGRIEVAGEALSAPGLYVPPEQRRIGMVFQDYALFPHLDIATNIAFGLRGFSAEQSTARVDELLELIGLIGRGNRYPHEISGGQQQRVALARALAPRPRLLLLDEPFSNLDVELRERLSQEVRDILKLSGTTAILVTHDQHEAFAIADKVGVMRAGRIEQWDTPYRLYHQPGTRYVADFIGQGAFLPGQAVDAFTVQIELGALQSRSSINFQDTAPLQVLLRPDDVVHDDASPMKAEVVNRIFRGAEFLYTLKLESGTEVLSLVPSHHNHAIGERIGIRLDADHVVTFRAEPAA